MNESLKSTKQNCETDRIEIGCGNSFRLENPIWIWMCRVDRQYRFGCCRVSIDPVEDWFRKPGILFSLVLVVVVYQLSSIIKSKVNKEEYRNQFEEDL